MNKHTPGPWATQQGHGQNSTTMFVDHPTGKYADPVASVYADTDEGVANACLIAAAPELLEALEALLMAVRCNAEGGRPRTADEIYAMAGPAAQAAIAKARGEIT